eukprot:SAG22_NODE_3906_length_1473_cov_1.217455_1_plen_68_part_10
MQPARGHRVAADGCACVPVLRENSNERVGHMLKCARPIVYSPITPLCYRSTFPCSSDPVSCCTSAASA